ncbi:MAG: HEPN domain-containing protein [Candidatus Aenigmatarchaeota archaeon]
MKKIEEAKILRKRALSFLKNAEENIKRKEFDLAAFHCEQASRLILKYFLFVKVGEYPKTHSLKLLFKEVIKIFPKLNSLFIKNLTLIGDMEGAYIGARYLPFQYTNEEAKQMISFCKKLIKVLDEAL